MESRSVGEKLSRRIQKRSVDSGLIESVGAFIYCVKTRRYLFLLRNNTKYAGTWGVVGGKVEANEQIIESLSREIEEELSIDPNIITFEFKRIEDAKGIDFHYYEGFVDDEFEPVLNFENLEYLWCDMSNIPTPLYEKLQDKIEMLLK